MSFPFDSTLSGSLLPPSRSLDVSQRLLTMGCPYLEGMEASLVKEVVLTPGGARTRILQWLVGRFHPSLQSVALSIQPTISCIPRLTALLADMGLCAREDYELVKGSTSVARQLLFLESLLDLVELSVDSALLPAESLQSLSLRVERCCQFADALCRQEDLAAVFPRSASLLPPALATPTSNSTPRDTRAPSLAQLAADVAEVQGRLEAARTELDHLVHTHVYADLDLSVLESYHKSLAVALGTLSQLASSFRLCYEAELQPWTTDRPTPQLSNLGPLAKRMDTHSQHLSKLLRCFQVLESSFTSLESLQCIASKQPAHCGSNVQQVFQQCRAALDS